MLLALDAGNSNVTIGAFNGDQLIHRWRLRTIQEQTADEWGVLMRNLFSFAGLELREVDGIIIASVVPPLNSSLADMSERYFATKPIFVTHETDTGVSICYDNPLEIGADRIVNSVAAWNRFHAPCIVVDLGTAITFDTVSGNAEYLGGIICPGIAISVSALFSRTARLPLIDFREPSALIGKNTVTAMQSGLYYGFTDLIDGLIDRLTSQLGAATKVIGTGGQAHMIFKSSRHIREVDEDITLTGLNIIWQRVRGRG
jgi:type III pantothenate kinase